MTTGRNISSNVKVALKIKPKRKFKRNLSMQKIQIGPDFQYDLVRSMVEEVEFFEDTDFKEFFWILTMNQSLRSTKWHRPSTAIALFTFKVKSKDIFLGRLRFSYRLRPILSVPVFVWQILSSKKIPSSAQVYAMNFLKGIGCLMEVPSIMDHHGTGRRKKRALVCEGLIKQVYRFI